MYRVAIVGRPNVGKSTLFNRLTGSRKAIVGDEPGITRDRIIDLASWGGKVFEVIDTGGIIPDEKNLIPGKIIDQAALALQDSHLILLTVDIRAGVTPLDESLTAMVRATGKPCFLVANKADTEKIEGEAVQFHALGLERIFAVSAEHNRGIVTLIDEIIRGVPDEGFEPEPGDSEGEIRVAIIGRPNVGKSSLLNRLVGRERVIVTDIPGTTRDSVDTLLTLDERRFRLIDTAGIRRKGKTSQMAEKLSVVMARKSLTRADVALLLIDATEGATKLDAVIGGYAHDAGTSIVLVVNKWDLIEKETQTARDREQDFREKMRFLDYAPMIFVSAKSGQRVSKILELVREAYQARFIRVPTAEINQFLKKKVRPHMLQPGSKRRFPVLYGTQAGTCPPTFVLFSRSTKAIHFSVIRFLVNQLREAYGFFATPVRVVQRRRVKDSGKRR